MDCLFGFMGVLWEQGRLNNYVKLGEVGGGGYGVSYGTIAVLFLDCLCVALLSCVITSA